MFRHRRFTLPRAGLAPMLSALCAAPLLAACATTSAPVSPSIEIPLAAGWFEGQKVFYITTDMSDPRMAQNTGTNYVPRLAYALPPSPPDPSHRSSVDRIYKFFDGSQASVLPSAPAPLGGSNANDEYSPLWQLVKVSWLPGVQPVELHSEEEVLEAADAKRVALELLPIIVNCPVVQVGDQLLYGTRRTH